MNKNIWPLLGVGIGLGAAILPVMARAPEPVPSLPRDVRNLEEAMDDCQGTRLAGWELVDYATRLVNRKCTRYSLWHLWETSGRAFENSRGFSEQYNLALGRILAGLGFQVQVVRAERVRFDTTRTAAPPAWAGGHTWLRVTFEGQTRDVCASRGDHRAGAVRFTPLGEVRAQQPWTGVISRLRIAPAVLAEVWQAWLAVRPVPRWIYRGFHDQG